MIWLSGQVIRSGYQVMEQEDEVNRKQSPEHPLAFCVAGSAEHKPGFPVAFCLQPCVCCVSSASVLTPRL